MLPSGGLDVSMTSELGDALLTIVKHDVAAETRESTARRRLEYFVLRAEALVVRLAERQEAIRAEQATAQARRDGEITILTERLAGLERRLSDLLAEQTGLVQQVVDLQQHRLHDQGEFETYRTATTQALALLDAQDAALQGRLALLEARRLSARWARLVAWLRAWWP
jgi:flagellar biosynthesis/type III secretory pathway chaperone